MSWFCPLSLYHLAAPDSGYAARVSARLGKNCSIMDMSLGSDAAAGELGCWLVRQNKNRYKGKNKPRAVEVGEHIIGR